VRIVIDANILISGVFFRGKERDLLELWFSGKFNVICTEEIFEEYLEVLTRFTVKSGENKHQEITGIIAKNCLFIKNVYDEKYSRDPDDDKFINCAKSGGASYIVPGDKDLLVLKNIGDLKIITASNFLKSL
jgi:putative PIN family toxin of toxin-antitoxin system